MAHRRPLTPLPLGGSVVCPQGPVPRPRRARPPPPMGQWQRLTGAFPNLTRHRTGPERPAAAHPDRPAPASRPPQRHTHPDCVTCGARTAPRRRTTAPGAPTRWGGLAGARVHVSSPGGPPFLRPAPANRQSGSRRDPGGRCAPVRGAGAQVAAGPRSRTRARTPMPARRPGADATRAPHAQRHTPAPPAPQGPPAAAADPEAPPPSGAEPAAAPAPADDPCGHEHFSHRAPWLRAMVLGANDGLVSVAALMVGVSGGDASERGRGAGRRPGQGAARRMGCAGWDRRPRARPADPLPPPPPPARPARHAACRHRGPRVGRAEHGVRRVHQRVEPEGRRGGGLGGGHRQTRLLLGGLRLPASCTQQQESAHPALLPFPPARQADIEKERQEQLKGEHARRTEFEELVMIYQKVGG
jgi:hypothetical protein